jgi:ketosteroid isomerase-like protein
MKHICVGILAGLLLSGLAQAQCSDADKAMLEKYDRDWGAAGQAQDKPALEAIYGASYVDLQPGDISGRQAAIDAAPPAGAGTVTHDFYLISCTPNSALITHRNTVTLGESEGGRSFQTRSVHQLEKVGGKWKVMGNATHPLDDSMMLGYLDLEWNQAELAGDRTWFERTLADDYLGVGSTRGKFESKEDLLASVGKEKVTAAVTTDMDVNVDGDRARVSGIYHSKGSDEKGKAFDRRIAYIDVFVKRDGRWQIWSSQGTPVQD